MLEVNVLLGYTGKGHTSLSIGGKPVSVPVLCIICSFLIIGQYMHFQ